MIIILRSARTTLEDRVRIAFVGKGGSGKTTAAALFSRHLADRGHRVLAVDADINQHLGPALGAAGSAPRPLGADLPWLKDHLRGDNPRIPGPQAIIKTTPPGRGSRLVDLDPAGELLARFAGTAGGVHRQYAGHAAGHRVALRVLGNKVTGPDDVDYLRTQLGDALIGWLGQSAWVRAAERGAPAPLAELEPENRAVLDALRAELDVRDRYWAVYHRGTVEFHLRNAAAWGDQAVGADLAAQVDPDFVPGRPVPA
jgi:hypothetical protein